MILVFSLSFIYRAIVSVICAAVTQLWENTKKNCQSDQNVYW